MNGPTSSLALDMRRGADGIIGRPTEIAEIEQELRRALAGVACVTLEGEPGIGKTRLLVRATDLARDNGFVPVGVVADEQLRGPFLLARSVFSCEALREAVAGTPAADAVARASSAIEGRDDAAVSTLAPDQRVLRGYDLAALAIRESAAIRPVALLIDDVQWADDDSTRLLRYVLRTLPASRIFVALAIRAEATTTVTEATALIADLDRMGLLRHIPLSRVPQSATAEMLRRLLGGPVAPESVAAIHAQSEGVPFVTEELARAYRSGALLHKVDGTWTLSTSAERLVPSAVRTLIQRRALHVPATTRALLGEAAVLGRSFTLADLDALRRSVSSSELATALADDLAPAVTAGLLAESSDSRADYTFTHEQIREFALSLLSQERRRALHAAMVDLLGGEHAPESSLGVVAQHALEARDVERASGLSVRAAEAALKSNAPEEVIRIVDVALRIATAAPDRVRLLRARDDALAMTRRAGERLETLAELGALASALGDEKIELDVLLRRAAALRSDGDHSGATALARDARERAAKIGDPALELAACLELGQDLLRVDLGEGMIVVPTEADVDGAEEAYQHAVDLAQQLRDVPAEASAMRELGVVAMGRLLGAYQGLVEQGGLDLVRAGLAAGAAPEEMVRGSALQAAQAVADERFRRALALYESLGDRRGVMASVIGLAQASWGTEIRFGVARRIEDIRRLWTRMRSFTTETERAAADAQMLFGVTVFAFAKGSYDLALARGEEAHRAARTLGDRTLDFGSAEFMVRGHLMIGNVAEAQTWLQRAAAAAALAATPLRSGRLELLRVLAATQNGDAAAAREHLAGVVERREQEKPAERAAVLAEAALAAMRLALRSGDDELRSAAERSAQEALLLSDALPGQAPFGSYARAALAATALARNDAAAAAELATRALTDWEAALVDDIPFPLLLALGRVLGPSGAAEPAQRLRTRLSEAGAVVALRIQDEGIRDRFFASPVGVELAELADGAGTWTQAAAAAPTRSAVDDEILRLLAQGRA